MEQYILDELVQGIREALGDRVYRIILYGSVARGTNSLESDVDIDQSKFQKWKNAMPFYQSIEREGIVLWKAA